MFFFGKNSKKDSESKTTSEFSKISYDGLFDDHGTIVLEVPYSEKEDAKAMGARWNPIIKKWFIKLKSDDDREKFVKWIPTTQDNMITLLPKIYLLKAYRSCYMCNNLSEVFCFASDGLIDPSEEFYDYDMKHNIFLIYNLTSVPNDIDLFLKKHAPRYYFDYTKQSDSSYYVNHCSCGAKHGDFYLHNEPGGSFFLMSEEEAYKNVTKYLIYSSIPIKVNASYSFQDPDFIKTYAQIDFSLKLDS